MKDLTWYQHLLQERIKLCTTRETTWKQVIKPCLVEAENCVLQKLCCIYLYWTLHQINRTSSASASLQKWCEYIPLKLTEDKKDWLKSILKVTAKRGTLISHWGTTLKSHSEGSIFHSFPGQPPGKKLKTPSAKLSKHRSWITAVVERE